MSGKLGHEKNRARSSKVEKKKHQEPILKSRDFHYFGSRERLFRHSRWGLRHRRSIEGRERGEFRHQKIFVGIFCFEIEEADNKLTKVNLTNDSLTKKMKKTPRVVSRMPHNLKKKDLRANVKKSHLELVSSKLGRHLKLC